YNPKRIITAVYFDNDKKQYSVKRFQIETQTLKQRFLFIKEGNKNKLEFVTTHTQPQVELSMGKTKANAVVTEVDLTEKVGVSGWKALGNKLTDEKILSVRLLDTPDPLTEEELRSAQPSGNKDEDNGPVVQELFSDN